MTLNKPSDYKQITSETEKNQNSLWRPRGRSKPIRKISLARHRSRNNQYRIESAIRSIHTIPLASSSLRLPCDRFRENFHKIISSPTHSTFDEIIRPNERHVFYFLRLGEWVGGKRKRGSTFIWWFTGRLYWPQKKNGIDRMACVLIGQCRYCVVITSN